MPFNYTVEHAMDSKGHFFSSMALFSLMWKVKLKQLKKCVQVTQWQEYN